MRARALLYVAFACSGIAALIYETAWARLLGLFMGHTVAAASTVLAAFMGGLGAGAHMAGRFAPRLTIAAGLRAYAWLELLIGLLAIALPLELAAFRPMLAAAYADGNGGILFGAVRLAMALVGVALPAMAMGATLPLVVRAAAPAAVEAGAATARLYAANTIGATAGAIVSGFMLLPALGIRTATMVGVAFNVLSAALAFSLSCQDAPIATPDVRSRQAPGRRARHAATRAPRRWLAIAAATLALAGASSLMQQVAWTRILALVIGPTTYAFSLMVATFIAGIALGSLAGGVLARRRSAPGWLAASLWLSGLGAVLAAAWTPRIPLIMAEAATAPGADFQTLLRLQAAVAAAVMMPMTVAFGAAFPLAVGLAAQDDRRVAADVAVVYLANTAGAIVGALLGGFLLIPLIGLQHTVRAAALTAVSAAALVLVATRRTTAGWFRAATAVGAMVAITAFVPPWDRALLSSGAYKYAAYLPPDHRRDLLAAGTLLYYREGAAATVSVRRLAGTMTLAIDGKVDASNGGDMLTQRLLAHVPLLIHPDPRRVAIIGLGSGITLGSALRHPVEQAVTIELSPEVVEASGYFAAEHGQALKDPRARLVAGDGRSHLMLGRELYDVVISEPSNPWMAGVAGLFTREMFAAIRARLAPGGIVCQWAHAYDIDDADLRSILATFVEVFPQASLWDIGGRDLLLVGSNDAIEDRLATVHHAWHRPGVAADLASVGVANADILLSLFTAGPASLRAAASDVPIQRDDRLALEFTGPRRLYGRVDGEPAVLRALRSAEDLPAIVRQLPRDASYWRERGRMWLAAEAFDPATSDLRLAVEQAPDDVVAVEALLRAAAPAGRLDEIEQLLRHLLTQHPAALPTAIGLSRLLASAGRFDEAMDVLNRSAGSMPHVEVLAQWAAVASDAGNVRELDHATARLQQAAPEHEATLYFSAVTALRTGRPADAVHLMARLRARGAAGVRELTLLGTACATLGRPADAREAFEAAVAADPRDPTALENLGAFELAEGRIDQAIARLAEALAINPASERARQALADARRGRR